MVVGPSGSGKTTLLNLLGCVDVPTSGRLEVCGVDILSLGDDAQADFRAANIGYVFQTFNLIPVLTAYENIEYPLLLLKMEPRERRKRTLEMLDQVGLAQRVVAREGLGRRALVGLGAALRDGNHVDLVQRRKVGSFVHQLGIGDRYEQLYGDSRTFDATPYAGTIELGFIDGAHTRPYVENDTLKMAIMMADRGLVFWHDYGGRGDFRALTAYLDDLASQIRIFRVPNTTLAWAPASELRKLTAR